MIIHFLRHLTADILLAGSMLILIPLFILCVIGIIIIQSPLFNVAVYVGIAYLIYRKINRKTLDKSNLPMVQSHKDEIKKYDRPPRHS